MSARKTALDLIVDNSLEIYDLLCRKKIYNKDIYDCLVNNNDLLFKVEKNDKKYLKTIRSNNFKEEIFDRFLNNIDDKYKHLKDIRYIVNIKDIVEFVLDDSICVYKIKVKYANLILDKILEEFYDRDSVKLISKNKYKLIQLENIINKKIEIRLDEYYIRKITI